MLDLDAIERIRLSEKPFLHSAIVTCFLAPNYRWFPGVEIEVEGWERVPDGPVIFAMNHTDRYNYAPFQYRLLRDRGRYTAIWSKGKYFQHPAASAVLERANNIPAVSRGYLIARDFVDLLDRRPDDGEYRALRAYVDAVSTGGEPAPPVDEVPRAVFERSRDVLGMYYDATAREYGDFVSALFQRMMGHFVALNGEALGRGLDLVVFPEGTRSSRLGRGRIGIAQIALHFSATVVPVGCNGSDRVYPGDSPVARSGRIVYRIGEPLGEKARRPFEVPGGFRPFDPEAEETYRERFRGFVARIMERIEDVLDPEYRSADRETSTGAGTDRFV